MKITNTFTVTGTSPGSASTAVGPQLGGLGKYDSLLITASLLGATAGVLDVYIQRKITTNVWADWAHFTQLTAGSTAKYYSLYATDTASPAAPVAIGVGTDAAPGVLLAAGSFVGGMPGSDIRLVFVAGASTSLGAAQTIYVTAFSRTA